VRHWVFVESNTTGTGRLAVERLLGEGHRVTFLTRSPGRYPFLAGERRGLAIVEAETNDVEAVLRRVAAIRRRAGADALLTFSEFYVAVVAEAARRLGLRSLSPAVAARCRDKPSTRRALRAAGLPTPGFWVVDSAEQAQRLASRIGYPCVVKPPADSSSTGVRRVENPAELLAQFRAIAAWRENVRGQRLDGRVLIEEYLPGAEFSVETFTLAAGAHTVVGVTDKLLSPPPHFVELGHDFPSGLGEEQAALAQAAGEALDAVGYDFGPAHTELRWTPRGPVVMEINPRLAGGMIPELVAYATGVDLLGAWLASLVGEAVDLEPRRRGVAAIRFLVAAEAGRLARVEGLEAARALPGIREAVVSREPGALIAPAEDAYGRLGHLIAVGEDRRQVRAVLRRGLEAVRVVVETPREAAILGG
jgi:cysteine synthase A